MDCSERDQKPRSSVARILSDDQYDSRSRSLLQGTTSATPMGSLDFSENENNLVGFSRSFGNERQTSFIQMTGPLYARDNHEFIFEPPQVQKHSTEPEEERYPSTNQNKSNEWVLENYTAKNEHLFKSGQVGMCSDPYCTICPMYDIAKGQQRQSKYAEMLDAKFHNVIYGDAKGWAKRMCTFQHIYFTQVMNPHSVFVRRWNKFFVISCFLAVFLDPLFFFLLYVQQDNNCIVLDWAMTTTIVALRSMFDFI